MTYGLHPGRQGDIHFSMAVDPQDGDIVYLGGDRQGSNTGNSAGLKTTDGRLFVYDPAVPDMHVGVVDVLALLMGAARARVGAGKGVGEAVSAPRARQGQTSARCRSGATRASCSRPAAACWSRAAA